MSLHVPDGVKGLGFKDLGVSAQVYCCVQSERVKCLVPEPASGLLSQLYLKCTCQQKGLSPQKHTATIRVASWIAQARHPSCARSF